MVVYDGEAHSEESWVGGTFQHCTAIVVFFSEIHTNMRGGVHTHKSEKVKKKDNRAFLCVSVVYLAKSHQIHRERKRMEGGVSLAL